MKSKILIGIIVISLSSCLKNDFVSLEAQLKKDVAAIDAYLTQNNIDALKDASGIRVVIHTLGTAGLPPNRENKIKVSYVGKLFSNGTIFDQGTINDGRLTDFIYGWQIALALLPEGSEATLYIPSGYGYGSAKQGSIPANSILVFEVTLESVELTASQSTRLASDITAIDNYLASKEIVATEDPSGIRYVISQQGDGAIPTWYDRIKIEYTGKVLPSEEQFGQGITQQTADFDSRLINYIQGLQVGLGHLQKGGFATFYIPSVMAYGAYSTTSLPANSILIFQVELLDVIPE